MTLANEFLRNSILNQIHLDSHNIDPGYYSMHPKIFLEMFRTELLSICSMDTKLLFLECEMINLQCSDWKLKIGQQIRKSISKCTKTVGKKTMQEDFVELRHHIAIPGFTIVMQLPYFYLIPLKSAQPKHLIWNTMILYRSLYVPIYLSNAKRCNDKWRTDISKWDDLTTSPESPVA